VGKVCDAAVGDAVAWPWAGGARAGAASSMGKRVENSRRFMGPRIRGSWYAMWLAVRNWGSSPGREDEW
jgi:hypothetical protein